MIFYTAVSRIVAYKKIQYERNKLFDIFRIPLHHFCLHQTAAPKTAQHVNQEDRPFSLFCLHSISSLFSKRWLSRISSGTTLESFNQSLRKKSLQQQLVCASEKPSTNASS